MHAGLCMHSGAPVTGSAVAGASVCPAQDDHSHIDK